MERVARNLCYLLWRDHPAAQDWPQRLAAWAGCDVSRAEELLRRGNLRPDEQRHIADVLSVAEEDLQGADLLADTEIDILRENLRVLIDQLGRGGQARVASVLAISPNTVSRWYRGEQQPPHGMLDRLRTFFAIPATIDLRSEPIFLSPGPLSDAARRSWLTRQVARIPAATLHDLFPALERLLEER